MKRGYVALTTGVGLMALVLAGCASVKQEGEDYAAAAFKLLQTEFKSKGAATIERITQRDSAQTLCSSPTPPASAQAAELEKAQLALIKYPQGQNWLGDWKKGEAIAQNGRGMQSSDALGSANGANCYACHQITKAEISFGNIGPSLYQFAKLRGGNSPDLQRYTWGKIYNSQAYRACSVMPRFGHSGILSEEQIKDVMALLLDPASPVNQ
ncbi:MAG: sulfur oxidation c-type cytochrome SoxX [Burkholderiales bacterium]|nr:sulfur oxidation c-type cytochrome SoxX [Burkholderiales bacterium]